MKNLQEKVMKANFGRLLRRWLIVALCVALLGGAESGRESHYCLSCGAKLSGE